MMMSNGMMRNASENNVDKTDIKIKDENTTQAQSCENNVEIHRDSDMLGLSSFLTGLSALVMPTISSRELKELDDYYHDLDKRIAVVEALIQHISMK